MIELEDIIESTDTGYICKCSDYQELYSSIIEECNLMSSYLTCIDVITFMGYLK